MNDGRKVLAMHVPPKRRGLLKMSEDETEGKPKGLLDLDSIAEYQAKVRYPSKNPILSKVPLTTARAASPLVVTTGMTGV